MNEVYNVACGDQYSLNDMITVLQKVSGKNIKALYGPERPGDVKHSKADITKIRTRLQYEPQVDFLKGMEKVYQYYLEQTDISLSI